MRLRYTLLIIILGSILSSLGAQHQPAPELMFRSINTEDGLLGSNVSSIIQDDQGFLWFGTTAGLNRYDGYEFIEYNYIPFESNTLSHNQIQTMHLAPDGRIWVGTYGGLNVFDPDTGQFRRMDKENARDTSLSNNLIISVLSDSSGRLWVGTSQGLNLSIDDGEHFTRFFHSDDNPFSVGNDTIRAIHEDSEGNIWIGHYNGVSIHRSNSNAFENIVMDDENPTGLPGTYVMDITSDAENTVWLGMWEGFISRYSPVDKSFESLQIPADGIYKLEFDSRGRLWVATWSDGLFIVNPQDFSFMQILQENGHDKSLNSNLMYSLLEDETGLMWIGTRGAGINVYDPELNSFQVFNNIPEDDTSISPGRYQTIIEDRHGDLWIGTDSYGIDRLAAGSSQFIHYRHDAEDSSTISNDHIINIHEDAEGTIWIMTQSGLNRYNRDEDRFIRAADPFADIIMTSMFRTRDNKLLLGSYYNGLYITDENLNTVINYRNDPEDPASLSDNLVSVIFQDSRGIIWIGTNNGLNRFSAGGFTTYYHNPNDPESISGNKISNITEDKFGRLWIGTNSGGLNVFDSESRTFSHFTTRDGLPSNRIAAQVQDNDGRIWISTSRGLAILDPTIEGFTVIDDDDGLVSQEMNSGATMGADGTMYFGTNEGVQKIQDVKNPRTENVVPPVVRFTGIEVLDENYAIPNSGRLELNYNQNFLKISFAVMDFSSPRLNTFQYRLSGLDSDWQSVTRDHSAIYTDLSPGKYRFIVRGANNFGVWSSNTAEFDFVIIPPWYSSPPAMITWGFLVIIFIAVTINYYRVRMQLNVQRLEEESRINKALERRVAERTHALRAAREAAEDASKAKGQFLANISHDIRTPLNSILGYSEILTSPGKHPEQKKQLETIHAESKKLLGLIDQILDISKIEAGKMEVNPISLNFRSFMDRTTDPHSRRAAEKGLNFSCEISDDVPVYTVTDGIMVNRIIDNLISNALKFTEQGWVAVSVGRVSDMHPDYSKDGGLEWLRISVSDSGSGIPREKLNLIFESFEQIDKTFKRSHQGAGLGMTISKQLAELLGGSIHVESRIGQGSKFWVDIPVKVGIAEDPHDFLNPEPGKTYDRSILAGVNLLVVEDYVTNQEFIRAFFKNTSSVLTVVSSGSEALKLLHNRNFDVILMDVHMPGMDGMETTRHIRSMGSHARTPIIGLTADVLSETQSECLEAGMNDVLRKPINRAELFDRLGYWLTHDIGTWPESSPSQSSTLSSDSYSSGDSGRSTDRLVFNHEDLVQEMEGNEADVKDLLMVFLESSDFSIPGLVGLKNNMKELHRAAHSLKSGALQLMAFNLARSTAALEHAAQNASSSDDIENLDELISDISKDYQSFKQEAVRYL